MAQNEPRKLAVRSLMQRPAETVLLIIGVALGIGTTAGGIAMVANLRQEGRDLVESAAYREIYVSTRENAEDMDVPAYRNEADESVILTGADLAARDSAPDVQYAYTISPRRVRISNFEALQAQFEQARNAAPPVEIQGEVGSVVMSGRPFEGAPDDAPVVAIQIEGGPSEGIVAWEAPAGSPQIVTDQGSGGTAVPKDGETPTPREANRSQRENEPQDIGSFTFEMPEYEDIAPILEEISAAEVTPELFPAYGIQPAQGSLFTQQEIDAQRRVAIVGSTLAETLFEDGISLGRSILIGRSLYEIIGIAEPTGTDYDEYAFYPSYTAGASGEMAEVLARFRGFGTPLRFTAYSADRLDEAQAQLQSYFDTKYGSGAVVVSTPGTEAKQTLDRNSRLVTIILFLAVAGLLIAAVNVSNILYSRAMRKRKSVGILKALGATRQAVFALFLGEALAIGLFGTIGGIGVSIAFTRLLGEAYAASAIITGPMIAGALGALVITMVLTVVPALQASSIPAAEALRYE